jgi:hypothetical protein
LFNHRAKTKDAFCQEEACKVRKHIWSHRLWWGFELFLMYSSCKHFRCHLIMLFSRPQFSFHLTLFKIFLLLFWEYIVTFIKVVTIHHSWIHTLNHCPLFPLTPFLEQFQQVSFFHLHTCVHNICIIFTLLHPFPTSSPLLLVLNPR